MKAPPEQDARAIRIGELIALYIQGRISKEEHDELDAWVQESEENMRLFEELTDEKNIEKGLAEMQQADWKESSTRLLELAAQKRRQGPGLKTWLVAACFILLAGTGWWLINRSEESEKPVAADMANTADKAPGSNKAVLTLADGRTVELDGSRNGKLSLDGTVQVAQKDSSLVYETEAGAVTTQEVRYHELSTPRGGTYALVLPDGTRVWLNAASRIRYPTRFTARERRVEIEGEAYFEVASRSLPGNERESINQKFIVAVNGMEVEVLGTHFNVNAYAEEESSSVVLIEGAVEVRKGEARRLLVPGQEARIDKNSDAIVVNKVQAADAIGWKNGMFVFNDADMGYVVRQLGRWYDVDVELKEAVTEHINATIPRTLPLKKVINLLEKMGLVHFTLNEGKLQVHK